MRALLALLPLVLAAAGCIASRPRSRSPSAEAVVLESVPVRRFGVERCGAGSLSAVLSYYGDEVAIEELDAELPKADNGGVLSLDLVLAARRRGFSARLVEGVDGVVESALTAGFPVILMLRVVNAPGIGGDLFHYVVVDGSDPGHDLVRVQFGDGRARWIPPASIERSWRGAGFASILIGPAVAGQDAASSYRYAVALEEVGRLEEAAELYRSLVDDGVPTALAWVNLGNVEAARGRREAAELAYRRALELEPDQRDALNNLAWLLLEDGKALDEAERLAGRAVRLAGADPHLAHDTLGRVLLARGDCAGAIGSLGEAIATVPPSSADRAWLWYGLGLAQIDCRRAAEARRSLQVALSESGGAELSAEIGEALARVGQVRP